MSYKKLKKMSQEDFKRLTGVDLFTFKEMLKILKKAEAKKLARGGNPPKRSMEKRLLMTLEYWREYRTYFHIATNYKVSEATAYRVVRWIEDTLIKDKKFALPGKKALLKSDMQFEVVMVDATESQCERPKKNKSSSILARKNVTPKRRKSLQTKRLAK